MTRQLRLVVFSQSIISDIGNPQATTVRAMCQAFAETNHDVTHLEQRGNPALLRMLKTRGYAPMRAFNERYPQIRYRQYDLPAGAERAVWFGREIATADAVVAYPGAAVEVVSQLEARDSASVVRFWPGADDRSRELLANWTDPAVLPRIAPGLRDELLVVAYDDIIELDRPDWPRVSVGAANPSGGLFVPEVLVEDRYQRAQTVAMDAEEDLARILLPVANGATTELVDSAGETVRLITAVPPDNDARRRAHQLALEIDRLIADLLAPRS
jgi:hypothetical protein